MTYICDLHTHSTASDGQYSPSELAVIIQKRGIEVWALTDHDTVDGISEAMEVGSRLGVKVIPGIELSAKEYRTFHILGYGYRPDDPALIALCERMRTGRGERELRLLDYLAGKGVHLSLDEVEEIAGGKVIGRPHFAQALVRRGYAADNREAFDKWLDTEDYHAHVSYEKPSARECVETIKAAGGFASLAHPYQIDVDHKTLDAIVHELTDYGLDAIECFYPEYSPEQQEFYLYLTEKYSLRRTGGSDFHGERVKPDVVLAAWKMDVSWLTGELVK